MGRNGFLYRVISEIGHLNISQVLVGFLQLVEILFESAF